jgi:UDP-galactopyranose mutase
VPVNAREYLEARIGPAMAELVFGRYTRKMWAMSLDELDAAIVQRIQIRLDDEDRYFPDDSFQALPAEGYEALFARILAHKAITVRLETAFRHGMRPDYSHCFLSSPIDEFFEYRYGRLPYRSIRFHHALRHVAEIDAGTATVNFSDESPFTRATYWHMLPGHWIRRGTTVLYTKEEPCADHENAFERYYPVKDAGGRNDAIYRRYAALAAEDPGITFIGRCGTYQYLDMHQVINQSLVTAQQWLVARATAQPPPVGTMH